MIELITYNGTTTIEIQEKQLYYSPFLKTLITTDVHKDMVGDAYVVDNMSYEQLASYVEYLKTGNYDESVLTVDIMDYMGHNTIDVMSLVSLDGYVKVYFEDYWIRDHVNSLDKFHGLHYLKTVDHPAGCNIDTIKEALAGIEFYIAGGYAAHANKKPSVFSDIDIFICSNHHEVLDRLKMISMDITIGEYAISFVVGYMKYQVILCYYSTPTQIVHMFDIGPCQYIIDPMTDNLYCSKLALWCEKNDAIVFDSLRSSNSYVYRLWKYSRRTNCSKIIFPNEELVHDLYQRNKYKLLELIDVSNFSNQHLFNCICKSDEYKSILNEIGMEETEHNFLALSIMDSGCYRLKKDSVKHFNHHSRLIFLLGIVEVDMDYESGYDAIGMPEYMECEWKDPNVFRFGSCPYDTLEEYLSYCDIDSL